MVERLWETHTRVLIYKTKGKKKCRHRKNLELSGLRRGAASEWAGGGEWEKQKLNSGMQKYFFREIQTFGGRERKRGRDWHSNVNRERRVDWMKKPRTGGFLKSPFNMYEGTSIDSSSHKQATEQKGEESSIAGCAEKKELLSLSADFTVCPGSPEKGDHPEALFTIPCFSLTQQHNSLAAYRRLSVNNLRTKLQPSTIPSLQHIQDWSERGNQNHVAW